MKTLGCSLIGILLITLAAARGDVVIYKGTLKNKGSESTRTAPTIGCYLLVDYATKEVQSVTYFKKDGLKLGEFEVGGSYESTATTVANKATRVISDSATTNGASFSFDFIEYRGAEVSLVIRKEPGTTTIVVPKSLTALHHFVSSSGYFATDGLLTFQSKLTVDANNDSLSISDARQRIQDHLHDDLKYAIP